MRWVPGGTFLMGSEDFYPEERPVPRRGGRLLDGRATGDGRRLPKLRVAGSIPVVPFSIKR